MAISVSQRRFDRRRRRRRAREMGVGIFVSSRYVKRFPPISRRDATFVVHPSSDLIPKDRSSVRPDVGRKVSFYGYATRLKVELTGRASRRRSYSRRSAISCETLTYRVREFTCNSSCAQSKRDIVMQRERYTRFLRVENSAYYREFLRSLSRFNFNSGNFQSVHYTCLYETITVISGTD